ncbi:hypothetical protein [Sphingomonas jaspsi]|jgi:hypothetical protein|uniref:hypothetical protein n=1 Tax=Sphingomonas jaspsi TaxID=392409 RepID=UPI0004B97574|nr:hypothetical protein [Sphingomonas jaspsi]
MIRTLTLTAVAALALAACNKEDKTIVAGPADPMADQLANAAPVELPPSIQAAKTYRCKDNSLVYIDWLSDGTARVKESKTDVGAAPAEGALTGDATSATITLNGKSCKA